MKSNLVSLVFLLIYSTASAQSENQKSVKSSLDIHAQIRFIEEKINAQQLIDEDLLSEFKNYVFANNWQEGKMWYYYFSINQLYHSNTSIFDTNFNFYYAKLLEAFKQTESLDSTQLSIVEKCKMIRQSQSEFYWLYRLSEEAYRKIKTYDKEQEIADSSKFKLIYSIVVSLMHLNITYNLEYYINELQLIHTGTNVHFGLRKSHLLFMIYSNINDSQRDVYRDSTQWYISRDPHNYFKYLFYNNVTSFFLAQSEELDSAKYYLNKSQLFINGSFDDYDKIDYSVFFQILAAQSGRANVKTVSLEHSIDNLAHYLIKIKQYTKATYLLRELYQIKFHKKDFEFIIHILPLVIEAYKGIGNLDSALYFSQYYNYLSDSINRNQQRKTYHSFIAELESDVQAKELSLQYKDKAIGYRNRLLGGSVAIVLITLLFILSLYRNSKLKLKYQAQRIDSIKSKQERNELAAKIKGAEEEKKNLAIELHDGIANDVWALNLNADKIKRQIPDDYVTHAYVKEMKKEINQVFENVLNLARNLKPNLLIKNGLSSVIVTLCERVNEQYSRQIIQLEIVHKIPRFELEQELTVYRIVQELIFNALKHAKAQKIYVQMAYGTGCLNITVEDDGLGINNYEWTQQQKGQGLQNIQERVKLLNGHIEFSSLQDSGTSVYIEFENLNFIEHE